jgi:hypothetical protein
VKPEAEWFRKPEWIDCGYCGDAKRYLWVAEPVLHEIFGVAYVVSMNLLLLYPDIEEYLKKASLARLHELIERHDPKDMVPEGSYWEAFKWEPVLTRDVDGTVRITGWSQGWRPPPPDVHPILVPLDTKNLYTRPGRFISVDGSPSELTQSEIQDASRASESTDSPS